MYNFITKNICLPISDKFSGWGVYNSLNFLQKSQFWSKDNIQVYQLEKLRKIVEYAYIHVPFYRQKFDEYGVNHKTIKNLDDIKKFPVITKHDIVENFHNGSIISDEISKQHYLYEASSGSTGEKTEYYIDKTTYGLNLAANLRGWSWMGYQLGDKMIKITQNTRSTSIKKIQDSLDRVKLFTLKYDENCMQKFIETLYSYHPLYLRSYPDPLIFLANYLRQNNVNIPNIKAINTTGNILFPDVREKIEHAFHCKIFDSYSCEGGPNVFECGCGNYHISDEFGLMEIVNEENTEVKCNEIGRVITTSFFNHCVPFIRYDSKDLAQRGDNICPCGRQLGTIKKIIGRDNDILLTPSGQFLIGQTFTTFFKHINEIIQFQVEQTSKNNLHFRLKCSNEGLSDSLKQMIIEHWLKYTSNEMTISLEVVDTIPVLPSGKNRFLIRNPEIKIKF